MNILRSWLCVPCVALLLAVPGDGDTRPGGNYAEAGKTLEAVNQQARAFYAAARERAVAGAGPIVLYSGDEVTLRYGGVRLARRITPALYHDLKTIGHLALALDVMLGPGGDASLGERRLFELRQHRELIEKAGRAIRQRGLTKEQEERQQQILRGCDEYLDGVLRERKVDGKQLVALMRKLRPLLDQNSADAVKAQLDELHREMLGFKGRLSEADWKRLTVIIQSEQQMRKDNVALQYFARLLGEPGEGRRIVYAESLYDEAKALALLGTKLLDLQVGGDVYDDPQRLYRDLLGDAAKAHLDEMFKK
jgi:hypothetical protein